MSAVRSGCSGKRFRTSGRLGFPSEGLVRHGFGSVPSAADCWAEVSK